ncbi:N-acetylglucosamine-6-phosphate deacetylase [Microlunatus ginsengisoli]|uniref:N-acetylglucosamine-6-phosphate deacetylase n=1 Tax=Microlunatus ginsengisoli TaxID=363863 RepID=A0ABP6ZKI5_9ACTN
MSQEQRLVVDRVVTPDGVVDDARVLVADGQVVAVEPTAATNERDVAADGGPEHRLAGWLVPGFVDIHCHGGGGADLASADPDEIRRAIAFHRKHGTTTSYASLVSARPERLEAQIAALVPLVEAGELAGIHLEGPYLSPLHRGAHDPDTLATPTSDGIARLLDAGRGHIRMVTLAPELSGGLAAVEQLVAAGVTVAFGHSDADELMLREALAAGATVATHLFNAMRPIHHREPGPVPRLLTDDRVTVELICDGFHLHPDVIAMAIEVAGPERAALVTDAMLAAGVADGDYQLGGLDVAVTDGQARLVEPDGSLGSIAGSTLTMAAAFEQVVAVGVAIPDAARMGAGTPARSQGLDGVGEIRPGARADFCLVDDAGRLQRVMRAGSWL